MARPPARSPDAYRALIMQAAESVMAEVGPANTKMADIARQAGISYGALYRHFQDREDLLLAVMLHHTRLVEQSWLRSAEDPAPLDRIVALTVAPLVNLEDNPRVREIMNALQGAEAFIRGAQDEVERLNTLLVNLTRTAVQQAKDLGHFVGLDTDATVMTLTGISLNYTLHSTLPPPASWKQVAQDVEQVVRALAGPGSRARTRARRK